MAEPEVRDGQLGGGSNDPLVPARLSMVVLNAHDLPGLRRFYRALGWTEQPGASDSLARYQLGGVDLALYPYADDPAAAGTATTEPRSAVTLVITLATADGVDDAFGAAVGAGAQPVSDPQDQPWGGRSAVVADPEGSRWELLWVPRPNR